MRPHLPAGDPPLTARGALRWAVVEPLLAGLHPSTVLELGCGVGSVGARIARHARYTGVEPDLASSRIAAGRIGPRGGTVLHGDAGVLPWGTRYDVVCAFEVLEHIEDDGGALRVWLKHLRPGGHLVVSVPEDPDRFGPSDVQVGHHRRYTEQSLAALLTGAGLEVSVLRHYGWPLGYLLESVSHRAAARALARETPATTPSVWARATSVGPPAARRRGRGRGARRRAWARRRRGRGRGRGRRAWARRRRGRGRGRRHQGGRLRAVAAAGRLGRVGAAAGGHTVPGRPGPAYRQGDGTDRRRPPAALRSPEPGPPRVLWRSTPDRERTFRARKPGTDGQTRNRRPRQAGGGSFRRRGSGRPGRTAGPGNRWSGRSPRAAPCSPGSRTGAGPCRRRP